MSAQRFAAAHLLLGFALLVGACGDDAKSTQTVIVVEADLGVRQRADHTTLVVTADTGAGPAPVHSDEGAPRPASFPYVIALAPRGGDANRLYRVEVKALAQGQPIAVARVISGYVLHETRYVTLRLEDACLDRLACGADQTCHAGTCIDAHVDAHTFGRDRDSAPDISMLPPLADGGAPDGSTADGGLTDASRPGDAGATRDAGAPTDAGTPDAATDAGPPDAGAPDAGNDSGAPIPDSGTPDSGPPASCTPTGTWNLQFTETSGTCNVPTFTITVSYQGALTDYLSDPVNCTYSSELSTDGCELEYDAECTSVDANAQPLFTYEEGKITMTGVNSMSGELSLDIAYADGSTCYASGTVIGAPASP